VAEKPPPPRGLEQVALMAAEERAEYFSYENIRISFWLRGRRVHPRLDFPPSGHHGEA